MSSGCFYHPLTLDALNIFEKTDPRIKIRGNRLLYWHDTNQNVISGRFFHGQHLIRNYIKIRLPVTHTKMQIVEHDLPIMCSCYILHVFHKTLKH